MKFKKGDECFFVESGKGYTGMQVVKGVVVSYDADGGGSREKYNLRVQETPRLTVYKWVAVERMFSTEEEAAAHDEAGRLNEISERCK